MAVIINREEILSIISKIDVVAAMEEGFVQYSNGETVVPPVGELLMEEPRREVHIKYGFIQNDDFICIKIAGGFYGNTELGISTSQGLMLLLSQTTGETKAIILDDGYLTDVRTAAAGALATKYFAPKNITAIGIIGTGIQSRFQLQYLKQITACKEVWVWGRNTQNVKKFHQDLSEDYGIRVARDPSEVAKNCNLIVTTTPSTSPLLFNADIQSGTHITAVGSDTAEKQELEGSILSKADILIADSIPQSKSRGEIYRAEKEGLINPGKVVEFGNAIQHSALQRSNDDQISVVDLTGVAVQDIMIARSVYENFIHN